MPRDGRQNRGNDKRHRYAKRKHFLEKKRQKEALKSYAPSQRRRMCGSKVRYKSVAEAEAVARYRMNNGAPKLRTYRCPICGGWHLTSKELWKHKNHN